MKYRVLLRRNADGLERWSNWYPEYGEDTQHPGRILFNWLENNYSCDCNRHLEFERAGGTPEDELWGDDDDDDFPPCGHTRYDVLRIETDDGRVADEETGQWAPV